MYLILIYFTTLWKYMTTSENSVKVWIIKHQQSEKCLGPGIQLKSLPWCANALPIQQS